MTWIAVGVAAATVIGGVAGSAISANAAGDAADTQAAAARDANATQLEMFNRTRDDLLPYREYGRDALQRLYMLAASDDLSAGTYPTYSPTPAYDPSANPYRPVPAYTGPSEADLRADPGYQFRVSEGQKALERSAAGKGLLLSGGQLKDLTRFGQDMGAQEYGAAYTRGYARNQDLYSRTLATNQLDYGRSYQHNSDLYGRNLEAYQTRYNTLLGLRRNTYGELAGVAGSGMGAENTLATLGGRTGEQLAATTIGAGNAQAAGQVGQANAWNAGLSSVAGAGTNYLNYQLMSQYFNRNQATVGGNQYGQTGVPSLSER